MTLGSITIFGVIYVSWSCFLRDFAGYIFLSSFHDGVFEHQSQAICCLWMLLLFHLPSEAFQFFHHLGPISLRVYVYTSWFLPLVGLITTFAAGMQWSDTRSIISVLFIFHGRFMPMQSRLFLSQIESFTIFVIMVIFNFPLNPVHAWEFEVAVKEYAVIHVAESVWWVSKLVQDFVSMMWSAVGSNVYRFLLPRISTLQHGSLQSVSSSSSLVIVTSFLVGMNSYLFVLSLFVLSVYFSAGNQ